MERIQDLEQRIQFLEEKFEDRIQFLEEKFEDRIQFLEKKFNEMDVFLKYLSSLRLDRVNEIDERLEKMHRDVTNLKSWVPRVDEILHKVEEKLTPPEPTEELASLQLDTRDDNYLNNLYHLEQIKQGAPKKTDNKRHTGFQTRKIF